MGPVTKNTEKVKEFSDHFASQSFNGRICLQESQASETREKVWSKKDLTLGRSGIRVGTLKQAGPTQSVRPDGVHHKCGLSWPTSCLSWL